MDDFNEATRNQLARILAIIDKEEKKGTSLLSLDWLLSWAKGATLHPGTPTEYYITFWESMP